MSFSREPKDADLEEEDELEEKFDSGFEEGPHVLEPPSHPDSGRRKLKRTSKEVIIKVIGLFVFSLCWAML